MVLWLKRPNAHHVICLPGLFLRIWTEPLACFRKILKTKTEFPAKTDSNCTAKCYAAAKEACDADPECKILCDLIDMATGCMASLSIATACAIYCNF